MINDFVRLPDAIGPDNTDRTGITIPLHPHIPSVLPRFVRKRGDWVFSPPWPRRLQIQLFDVFEEIVPQITFVNVVELKLHMCYFDVGLAAIDILEEVLPRC